MDWVCVSGEMSNVMGIGGGDGKIFYHGAVAAKPG
jgi:hypothetical protein